MRFSEYFVEGGKPFISFEVFPPKTDKGFNTLKKKIVPSLLKLDPSFFTVTYGAMGSTQSRTVEIASLIRNDFGKNCACHFTCVGASRSQLDEVLSKIHEIGIRNIVALRGDPPAGATKFVAAEDGCAHANELIEHIRDFEKRKGVEPFGIAVAGYPEKHLEAADLDTDLKNLKRKVDAGADIVITQLFYDNADFFSFVEKARAMGIDKPIVPGLMPITNAKQIQKITQMCGAKIPADLNNELEAAGDDAEKVKEIGVESTIRQATDLLKNGVPGIHFYVMNRSIHMVDIINALKENGSL